MNFNKYRTYATVQTVVKKNKQSLHIALRKSAARHPL